MRHTGDILRENTYSPRKSMIKEKSPYLSNLPPVSIYSVETSRETSNTRQRKSLRKSLKVSTQKSLKKSKRSPRKSKGSRISTEHSPYA